MKYLIEDLEGTVKEKQLNTLSDFNFIIYTESTLMKNVSDYFKFFYPNVKVYTPMQGEIPIDLDLTKKTIVYGDTEFYPGMPVEDVQMVTVKNFRYKTEIKWFKGIIGY